MRDLSIYELRLKRISKKLQELKKIDDSIDIFSPNTPKYELSDPISIEEVEKIEQKYNINLPDEYVAFITTLGNGGAGPYLGLNDLEYSIQWSKLNVDINKPSMFESNELLKEFLRKCAIVAYEEDDDSYGEIDKTYKASNMYNGTISITSGGCDIDFRLIINGCNHGKIVIVLWESLDEMELLANNEDLLNNYFEKHLKLDYLTNFLNWYENWLNNSIKKCKEK